MSTLSVSSPAARYLPEGNAFRNYLALRHRKGALWLILFQAATLVSILALTALLYNIINQSFGLIAVRNKVEPEALAAGGTPLEDLDKEQLIAILEAHVSKGVLRRLESEMPFAVRSREDVYALVQERIVSPEILRSWTLFDSLFRRQAIQREMEEEFPGARLQFRAWINVQFLRNSQSATPAKAGVRTAFLGSLWIVGLTILLAFPIGVGAAIYLEEYAANNLLNRVIQTNINNLAGVPSIIYGMLGLAIFVRGLEPITSGAVFGLSDPTTANGRTILSASLTLALLILPMIIINAQESIRAVPRSLREASYAVGATHWQTIWHHVLPSALPGILTGTIFAMSRAMGETAPLVVVGASTFIAHDPTGPFSKFTTLPMQIYQWTARPQDLFRNLAAAAIIVLLVLLLALNAVAIILRNRYSAKRREG